MKQTNIEKYQNSKESALTLTLFGDSGLPSSPIRLVLSLINEGTIGSALIASGVSFSTFFETNIANIIIKDKKDDSTTINIPTVKFSESVDIKTRKK